MLEILKSLLSIFLTDDKFKSFSPIVELLSKNSFDLHKTLKNLNLEAIAPIIKAFFSNMGVNNGQNKTPTENSVGEVSGLNPIANVADKDIVYTLNKYFA